MSHIRRKTKVSSETHWRHFVKLNDPPLLDVYGLQIKAVEASNDALTALDGCVSIIYGGPGHVPYGVLPVASLPRLFSWPAGLDVSF